jgi:hypothetical protein
LNRPGRAEFDGWIREISGDVALNYIADMEGIVRRQSAAFPEDELSGFVISRLTELVVVLFNDHVGRDPASWKDRAEGRAVLLALGDVAADHGRPELTASLHDLADKIETGAQRQGMEPDFERQWYTGRITYRW